jgi:phosphonopyruvate decarboxylase
MSTPSSTDRRIPADVLRDTLLDLGFDLFTGVPCSFLGELLALLEREAPDRYVAAANEGAALATACGATLAGRRAVVLLQNSGLGNLVNPLTSLATTFEIPVLLVIGYRGDPQARPDEPQHRLMGAATTAVLNALRVRHWRLPGTADEAVGVLRAAAAEVAAGRSAVVLVGKGTIGAPASADPPVADEAPAELAPEQVIKALSERLSDQLVVTTTGYTSRRMFAHADRPGNFYMQGSMGHAVSIGLGLALSRPDRRFVVVDGDGAALMHLGALSTVGAQAPANLSHLILDNGRYESTGGQPTGARAAFDAIALAAGYRHAARCRHAGDLDEALAAVLCVAGPALLHVAVGTSPDAPPRATSAISPRALRQRFATTAAGITPVDPSTARVAVPRS